MSDPYRFAALGPFAVPLKKYKKYRLIDFDAVGEVFEEAERECKKRLGISGVSDAIGCYILALKPPGGQKVWPYYVGQTCGQTLATRVFQKQDKVAKYKGIMKSISWQQHISTLSRCWHRLESDLRAERQIRAESIKLSRL